MIRFSTFMTYHCRHIQYIGLIIISVLVLSCENKIPVIPKSDLLTLPSLTAKDFKTVLSDSGLIQLVLTAPIVEKYDNADPPYDEFKQGINVSLYNGKTTSQGRVSAKYAKCTSSNLWELHDSVVVINDKNEKLETEVLYWNQEKDKIYTDRFVKITSEEQIVQGIGFESDSHLTHRRIKEGSAIIYVDPENTGTDEE
jgi:LPS export ABC transporter protein LptC